MVGKGLNWNIERIPNVGKDHHFAAACDFRLEVEVETIKSNWFQSVGQWDCRKYFAYNNECTHYSWR